MDREAGDRQDGESGAEQSLPENETDESPSQLSEPSPQSPALRRQQQVVGAGVAMLAGIAVVVAGLQQGPGYPFVVYLGAGVLTTAVLFYFLSASVFQGEEV